MEQPSNSFPRERFLRLEAGRSLHPEFSGKARSLEISRGKKGAPQKYLARKREQKRRKERRRETDDGGEQDDEEKEEKKEEEEEGERKKGRRTDSENRDEGGCRPSVHITRINVR